MLNNISITSDDIEMTPAIADYFESKLNSLGRYINFTDDGVTCTVRIRREEPAHKNGEHIYHVDVTINAAGEVFRADANRDDLYVAIDEVKDDLERLITKGRGRRMSLFRRGARRMKELLQGNRE